MEETHEKILSILMGLGLILILVGCSSQETATFTQKSGNGQGLQGARIVAARGGGFKINFPQPVEV